MLKVLSSILCDLDPKVKVIGQKAGICDGVPSTSALVFYISHFIFTISLIFICKFIFLFIFSIFHCVAYRQPYKGCPFECNLAEITRNETVWRMRTNNVKGVYSLQILKVHSVRKIVQWSDAAFCGV